MTMRGFSLVEMGIVLVLLGALSVLLAAPLLRAMRSGADLRAGRELEKVRAALIGYAQAKNRLPENLPDAAQATDLFGGELRYFADSYLLSHDVCADGARAADLAELRVRTAGGVLPHVAFYVGTPGRDKQWRIAYGETPIDVREPGDDQVVYVSWYQLRALVCAGEAGEN